MSDEKAREKLERKWAAGRLAIDMLIDTWNQFAVGDNKRKWADGLSTLEDIEEFLRLHKLIDERGQLTDKAKYGVHLVLDRPDEAEDRITELETKLKVSKSEQERVGIASNEFAIECDQLRAERDGLGGALTIAKQYLDDERDGNIATIRPRYEVRAVIVEAMRPQKDGDDGEK